MMSETMILSQRGKLLDTLFKQNSGGFVYYQGDSMPELLEVLLPSEISAAAGKCSHRVRHL